MEPIDSALLLEDVSAVIQQQYMPKFVEQYVRWGKTTNKLFKTDSRIATGDGITLQTEVAPADTVRATNDPLAPIASPDFFEPTTIKARFNKQTPSTNDFLRFSGSAQINDIDIQNAGRGSIVNIADRIYQQVMPDFEEKLAIHRHLPRSSNYLALVNGTPKQDDSQYFSGCSATPTNSTGLRVPVDAGSIAYFKRGTRVDVYKSDGTRHAGNVRVTYVNKADYSIGLAFITAATGVSPTEVSTVGDSLANIADNDEIYISGERNTGMYSMGAYFSRPSSSDSFIGGVNRSTAINRYLLATATREGVTSAKITKSMFNDLGIAMGFQDEDGISGVFIQDPTVTQTIRDELGEQSFIQLPTGDDRAKRFGQFGTVGLIYQHPTFGVTQIVADPLAPSNQVRYITPEDWSTMYYAFKGLQPVKEGGQHWYRMNESAPNTGRGLIWKADWYNPGVLDWCMRPWRQGVILNISAT